MVLIPKRNTPTHDSVSSVNGFPRYSENEMSRRHQALRRLMEEHGIYVVVIGGATSGLETSIQYFSNWSPLVESYLVVPYGGDPTLFVRLWNHMPDAKLISTVDDVRYGGDSPVEQAATVARAMRAAGSSAGGIGFIGPIRATDMEIFTRELPDARWFDLNADYRQLRLVKSDEEMIYMRIASTFNDRAIEAMHNEIRPGMREYELAKVIESVFLGERGTNLIHFTLSTSMADPRFCVPHQQQPERVIQDGDVIVTEISTTFWGYAGQILRSFTVGADPTPLYQDLYDTAMVAYGEIAGILRAGVTVGEILDASDVIHDAGFTIFDDLVHGQGGAYLPPVIRTRKTRGASHPDDYAYPVGAVLVVQPNVVTLDLLAGVQLGNALRITEDGAEVLQEYPMEFIRCS